MKEQMMEPKFRAWDAETGMMLYSDKPEEGVMWGFEDGELKVWIEETVTPSDPLEPPYPDGREVEGPYMLFTGLVDADGKEVWDGDILSYSWDPLFGDTFIGMGVVEWCDSGYWSLETGGSGILATTDSIEDRRVIGNIAQNPELLT